MTIIPTPILLGYYSWNLINAIEYLNEHYTTGDSDKVGLTKFKKFVTCLIVFSFLRIIVWGAIIVQDYGFTDWHKLYRYLFSLGSTDYKTCPLNHYYMTFLIMYYVVIEIPCVLIIMMSIKLRANRSTHTEVTTVVLTSRVSVD